MIPNYVWLSIANHDLRDCAALILAIKENNDNHIVVKELVTNCCELCIVGFRKEMKHRNLTFVLFF